ncbi:arf-GAP with coiled-coil, ANK repeat and PH domain-containing protein 2 [Euwallacea similis]|uniref:arf-GAP with coiled-coil, ANK repeat and PH domain-containing protein 2 n=1 Tax=Euwallacea similis TaxID=1736056 RepID=UPI00345084B2
MGPKIELYECLRDSPKFRLLLDQEEQRIDHLEQRMEKILKVCTSMIETGKTYVGQQSLFANSLWDLSASFRDDPDVLSALNKLIHSLQEMNKFHTTLLDQVSRIFLKNISSFVKKDIKAVRDYKSHFEDISKEYDNVLVRNSQVPRNKPQEVEEVQNILFAIKSCFGHQTLNYVNSIYVLQSKKRHEILSTLLSYMHARTAYYHQGEDLCHDLQPFFRSLANEIGNMRDETRKIEKEVEDSHKLVSNSEDTVVQNGNKSLKLEGYLFKRTSNAFKTWNRRWFYLFDNKLVYRRRTGDESETIMEDDLRICTIKPVTEGDRRFCFEIVSPSKSHILQADSEEMYNIWTDALQKAIGNAIQMVLNKSQGESSNDQNSCFRTNDSSHLSRVDNNNKSQKMRMLEKILRHPGNNLCADCKSPNPYWASINLGILMCIECSGVHRSLGVHYSKVRSLKLDDWEPEVIKVIAELGNSVVNKIYEYNVPKEVQRASEYCSGTQREEWIKSKYVDKKFIKKIEDIQSELLNGASDESNVPTRIRKWVVEKIRRTPTHSRESSDKDSDAGFSDLGEDKKSDSMSLSSFNEDATRNDTRPVWLFGSDLSIKPMIRGQSEKEGDTEEEKDSAVGDDDVSSLDSNILLYKASAADNLPVMCQALALGADKNWPNRKERDRYPLHGAVLSGSVIACAYLLLNGAKINVQDQNGRTPLHLATREGHTAQVCLFLKYKADQHIEDEEGKVPLSMAEQKEHADIVTLLRLERLNEEMRDSESGVSGSDMFIDVVRDFSRLSYLNSEQRPSNTDH